MIGRLAPVPSSESTITSDSSSHEARVENSGIVVGMGAIDAEVDQLGEVLLVVIGRSRRALPQIGAHLDAALVQMAGADQPVAAVVARPDQDEHAWLGFSRTVP